MLVSSKNPTTTSHRAHIGTSPERREDERLITGKGRFVDDVHLHDPLFISFVRSAVARGVIRRCDLTGALKGGGHAAFSGDDVAHLGNLSVNTVLGSVEKLDYPVLAHKEVLAVGQPVAAILSQTPYQAQTSAEAVHLDVQEEPFDNDISAQIRPERVPFEMSWREGDAVAEFAAAPNVVSIEVDHARLAPAPMECRAIAVEHHEETNSVTVWLSTQTPHRARSELARMLDVDIEQIHVIAPDVGGAFGMKASLYPEEVFAVWAAFKLKRSVRWTATRSEDFLSASHGRGLHTAGTLAFSDDGRFLALKVEVKAPVGCWLTNSCAIPAWNAARILPGPYDIAAFELHTMGVQTNTAPVGIYRGAGRPEAAMVMERLVEKAARSLGVDAVELRRRNLVKPGDLPLSRCTGVVLDSGDYPGLIEKLCATAGYQQICERVASLRLEGEIVGVGGSFFVEPCGTGWESATVRADRNGEFTVLTGGSSQGHGRETAFAQIAADTFQCELDRVRVVHGSSIDCPAGIGALASRSTAIGGSAVVQAARKVKRRMMQNPEFEGAIEETVHYEAEGEAWGCGFHLAEISISRETGVITVDKLHCCDDAGILVNPRMADGQLRGGIAQAIGEALMEHLVYDDYGQLLTASMMDYSLPRASDMTNVQFTHLETPSPNNLLGAKGIGEAGTIGAPAAVCNAVADALAPLGIDTVPLPMTSSAIWHVLKSAKNQPLE